MSDPMNHAGVITGRIESMINQGIDSWLRAMRDARRGDYDYARFVTDGVAVWRNGLRIWMYPLELIEKDSFPEVVLSLDDDDTLASGSTWILPARPGAQLTKPKLYNASKRHTIQDSSVAVGLDEKGEVLTVKLDNLSGLKRGFYSGDVKTDVGEFVAKVIVRVRKS